jgi:micrococcal nuclease
MDLNQKANYLPIVKIFLVIIFLPFVATWYVWQKTDWSKRNKWIATTGIVVFCLFALASSDENASLEAQKQAEVTKEAVVQAPVEKQEVAALALGPEPEEQKVQEEGERIKVAHVVDGDTIKLEDGQVVRYIGIDTPETVDPRKPVQCFGKEASAKNRELVEGKEVRLVKDTSETDKYKRLLRYIYVGDVFVNDYLVRNGYAHSSSYPPDVKHQDQFRVAEQEARENKRGLWADDACKTEEVATPAPVVTPKTIAPVAATSSTGSYACNCSKTCAQMSCSEAQYQLDNCGCSRRDADKDGIACDSDCQ